jgi:hypothetical protein
MKFPIRLIGSALECKREVHLLMQKRLKGLDDFEV